jgi:hypothetical protein
VRQWWAATPLSAGPARCYNPRFDLFKYFSK